MTNEGRWRKIAKSMECDLWAWSFSTWLSCACSVWTSWRSSTFSSSKRASAQSADISALERVACSSVCIFSRSACFTIHSTLVKHLSCRREAARRSMSLEILLNYSRRSLTVIRNYTTESGVCKFLLVLHYSYVCIMYPAVPLKQSGLWVTQGHRRLPIGLLL